MKRINIVLAIPHLLLLQGIHQSVGDDDELAIVGEATTWDQVPPLIESLSPDLVLLDWDLPELPPLRAIDFIRERHPEVKILVLSQLDDEEVIHSVLARGASGYVLKTIEPKDLPSALRQTARGVVYHSLGAARPPEGSAAQSAGLTAREAAVLDCVARGLSNRQIAAELSVTEQTVKFHLTNVYRKLGVRNRLSAARYAYQHALVDYPPTPANGADGASSSEPTAA